MKPADAVMLFVLLTPPAILAADETPEPAGEDTAAHSDRGMPGRLHAQELPDDFLGGVSDGSSPSADGTRREEESGDTMEQTLRTHTRPAP